MVLLQHKLNVKLSQRQILTPGLVQMVSVLALNKLELKDMINAEMVENPVLEELEDAVPLLDDVGRQEEERDRVAAQATSEEAAPVADEKKDPFEEIDFGSFFQEYLDPGYRSSGEMEEIDKPSFENFLSKPGNLSDHLLWQLGAISVRPAVHQAAQLIIGNLNEEGYLIASDEELLGIAPAAPPEADVEVAAKIVGDAEALGLAVSGAMPDAASRDGADIGGSVSTFEDLDEDEPGFARLMADGDAVESFGVRDEELGDRSEMANQPQANQAQTTQAQTTQAQTTQSQGSQAQANEMGATESPLPTAASQGSAGAAAAPARIPDVGFDVNFAVGDLHEALEVVRQFDPQGIACRDLRECLLYQLRYHLEQLQLQKNGHAENEQVVRDAIAVVDQHLRAVTLKQFKEIARAIGRPVEA
ncbi:MAG TPA: hypothetical protein VJK27_11590, partial [Terriglobales bacterium]|nr:hypothetical protein [Terriglobales bacterium]